MKLPLVSVLMTAYNREKYIGEAIESVLSSYFTDFELIIVDDSSKDKTVEIAKTFQKKDQRIKVYVNQQNLGDYPNRNKSASYACGKYIKYLDSDDIIYPHCLQVMVTAMEQFPEAGFGLCANADENKPYPVLLSSREAYLEHFNGYGHFNRAPGSSIIRKLAFDKVGGFSGERMIGDNELWFRIARAYPLVKIVTGLYWDRIHRGQERNSDYAKKQYPKLSKKVMINAFQNSECPLSEEEKLFFLKRIRKNYRKALISEMFS